MIDDKKKQPDDNISKQWHRSSCWDLDKTSLQIKNFGIRIVVLPQHPDNCIHRGHARFGHRDPKVIRHLLTHDFDRGIRIHEYPIKQVCEHCIKGKISRKPFPQKSATYTNQPLVLIHTDLCGPMPI